LNILWVTPLECRWSGFKHRPSGYPGVVSGRDVSIAAAGIM
jgi:hypothetical protein